MVKIWRMEKNLRYVSPYLIILVLKVPGTDLAHKGDIVHITVMGQPAVILGSLKAAIDLLDVRGTIHYIFCRRI